MSETKFQKIWKDPVWSKVISVGILGLITIVYNIIISITNKIDFITAFSEFWTIKIPLWAVILFALLITILVTYYSYKHKKKSKFQDNLPKFINKEFTYDENSLELDRQLFNKIRNELITQENIIWLKNNNFAGFSFKDSSIEPLDKFAYESAKSDFEFLNPELEIINAELIDYVDVLNKILLENIFTAGSHDRLTVPPEWEIEQPERFWKAVNDIHAASENVCNSYNKLIKSGRKTLKI